MFRELGEVSLDKFLSEYWQKRPLLIRGAFKDFKCPISPDELAGLSLEEGVHSRLVIKNDKSWSVEHGPFKEKRFSELKDEVFSLLVQEVDQYHSDVLRLKRKFRFLPDWRLDDVMISYATDSGGVGPHIDFYDVFLIQGLGQRLWKIGERCTEEPQYVEDAPIRIMQNFQTTVEYILDPGDMLYLPAMVPHDGIAIGESMTLSIGFRAPSYEELASAWMASLTRSLPEYLRYSDSTLNPTRFPGEITPSAIEEVINCLSTLKLDRSEIPKWFGRLVTEPKREESHLSLGDIFLNGVSEKEIDQFKCELDDGNLFQWDESVRFAYFKTPEAILCFINGEMFELTLSFGPLLEYLSVYRAFDQTQLQLMDEIEGAEDFLTVLSKTEVLKIYSDDGT